MYDRVPRYRLERKKPGQGNAASILILITPGGGGLQVDGREIALDPPAGPELGEKVANSLGSTEPRPPEGCTRRRELHYFFLPRFSTLLPAPSEKLHLSMTVELE